MNLGADLDDLARRLVDLAESAGPWDDPLPEVRRRAAAMTAEPDPVSTESSVFRSPGGARRSRRWFRSVDREKAAAAAAVVALVAGLGWVIHAGSGGDSAEKAATGGVALASSSAAAAAAPSATRAGRGAAVPGPTPAAAACVGAAPTSAVTLQAPARVRSGAVMQVTVRLTGRAAADIYAPLVVVMSKGRVVGRLVTKLIPPGPSLRPSAPTATSTTVTGRLRRSTCAQALATRHGPSVSGPALPPGSYQLVAVSAAAGTTVVSAPVTVTVTR